MAWVAFDRAIKSIDQYGFKGPRARWEELRGRICEEVIAKGYDPKRNSFMQYYGSTDVDASLLLIPQLGFLPPEDLRVVGTIEAIERELVVDGLVMRYPTHSAPMACPRVKAPSLFARVGSLTALR
jgi:GH15 family glucan-1,4-alpha-glucosidase